MPAGVTSMVLRDHPSPGQPACASTIWTLKAEVVLSPAGTTATAAWRYDGSVRYTEVLPQPGPQGYTYSWTRDFGIPGVRDLSIELDVHFPTYIDVKSVHVVCQAG
jgi:hypothetical protein